MNTSSVPTELTPVTVLTKANIYFDGRVVSHTALLSSGEKKTLGLIYPGTYHFSTTAAERMDIVAGTCHVTLDGPSQGDRQSYSAGSHFLVPAQSGFTISVESGICEYVCSFLS